MGPFWPTLSAGKVKWLLAALALAPVAGCGTTRQTDTTRTATEMLLVSKAIDQSVGQLDFSYLKGKTVFFDPQYLDTVVDKGYLISSLRQLMLASGCQLQEDRTKATYVVEARAGSVGTDRHSLLVGVPQMTMPIVLTGMPSAIPEIPFAKKTDQLGVAKIALFAYNRVTGKAAWQSGILESSSTAHDTWVLGAGPFRQGSIVKRTEFAGEEIPSAVEVLGLEGHRPSGESASLNTPMTWSEAPANTKPGAAATTPKAGDAPVVSKDAKPPVQPAGFTEVAKPLTAVPPGVVK